MLEKSEGHINSIIHLFINKEQLKKSSRYILLSTLLSNKKWYMQEKLVYLNINNIKKI